MKNSLQSNKFFVTVVTIRDLFILIQMIFGLIFLEKKF